MRRDKNMNKKAGVFAIFLCTLLIIVTFSGCTTTEKQPTKIILYYNQGNDARKLGCQLLKDSIEAITSDIKIEIQELAWAQYLDKLQKKEMPIFFLGWAPDYAHPDNYLDPFARSTGTYANRVGFADPEVDTWIDQAKQELNATKAKELYKKIEQRLFDQAVYLYVDQPINFHVERTWVQGYFYNPMFSDLMFKYLSKNGSSDDTTFVQFTIGGPRSLDPAWDYETAGGQILQNVYETLVFYKGASAAELEPLLATEVPSIENGGISDDGLTYTFHLRQNVTFHDGTKFNASAVKYSIDRAMYYDDPESPGWILTQVLDPENTSSVEVIDEYTVRFHLQYPYSPFLYCLAYTVADIVSPTYVEEHGGIQPRSENNWMDKHTCGTGPYMVDYWAEDNTYIVLKKNPNYWGEEPVLDTIRIEYIDEYNTRYLALIGGTADTIYVPREHANELINRESEGIRVVTGTPTFDVNFFGFNLAMPPFDNVNVRKAFCYAFDYETYYNQVQSGITTPLQGIIPKGMFGHYDELPIYTKDLDKAKSYLEQAGYSTK
jgi:ABC-type transport system substrate-binding protein